MENKYSKQELLAMSEKAFEKAMQEMREEAEQKGRDKLKSQLARRERLLAALNELWGVYQANGSGKLKAYIKDDLDRIVKASVDSNDED